MIALAVIWTLGSAWCLWIMLSVRAGNNSNPSLHKEILMSIAAGPLMGLVALMFAINATVWRHRLHDGRDQERRQERKRRRRSAAPATGPGCLSERLS